MIVDRNRDFDGKYILKNFLNYISKYSIFILDFSLAKDKDKLSEEENRACTGYR